MEGQGARGPGNAEEGGGWRARGEGGGGPGRMEANWLGRRAKDGRKLGRRVV